MKQNAYDVQIGIIALLAGLTFSFACLGVERTLTLLLICPIGAAVIRMWNGASTLGKVVAAIFVPAILMQFLLPKKLRLAVNSLQRNPAEGTEGRGSSPKNGHELSGGRGSSPKQGRAEGQVRKTDTN